MHTGAHTYTRTIDIACILVGLARATYKSITMNGNEINRSNTATVVTAHSAKCTVRILLHFVGLRRVVIDNNSGGGGGGSGDGSGSDSSRSRIVPLKTTTVPHFQEHSLYTNLIYLHLCGVFIY